MLSEAAHVEDNARRAAGFALGVAQQVEKRLEEAKKEAHEEAENGRKIEGRPLGDLPGRGLHIGGLHRWGGGVY